MNNAPQKTGSTPPSAPTDPTRDADRPDTDDPALQGEGNYTAARRHRQSVKDFVESGDVERAAREAAPDSAAVRRVSAAGAMQLTVTP